MIIADNVSFAFEKTEVLKNVSFSLEKGKILAILGANGAGKTTLLHCLTNILKPQSGRILISGKDICSYDYAAFAKMVGVVPQENRLIFANTVFDYVLMGRNPFISFFSKPSHEDLDATEYWLQRLDIFSLKNCMMNELSGGQKKMCAIARALVSGARIMIMDEPTAHLDLKNQREILRILSSLVVDKGITLCLSVHDPNTALAFADKALLLHNGKVCAFGAVAAVLQPEMLEKSLGIQLLQVNIQGQPMLVPVWHQEKS